MGSTLNGAGSKDVRYILETATEFRVPLPLASVVRDKITAAPAYGLGECDWSVFTEIARLNAGLQEAKHKVSTS
ncbi:MAG: hypothetical protein DMG30_12390 [Acidobacteria bacterium]|nr:MAG: hypothetical protein DMG30_12390 [Acidobacteriota bacterium]